MSGVERVNNISSDVSLFVRFKQWFCRNLRFNVIVVVIFNLVASQKTRLLLTCELDYSLGD